MFYRSSWFFSRSTHHMSPKTWRADGESQSAPTRCLLDAKLLKLWRRFFFRWPVTMGILSLFKIRSRWDGGEASTYVLFWTVESDEQPRYKCVKSCFGHCRLRTARGGVFISIKMDDSPFSDNTRTEILKYIYPIVKSCIAKLRSNVSSDYEVALQLSADHQPPARDNKAR
jgi:hypothetical protein